MIKNIFVFFKEGNERSLKAKKHIFLSFIASAIAIAISFIYVPLLLEYLDAERYGIWLTMTSIVGWFAFLDGGLAKGLKNNLVIALAKSDKLLAKEYISTTYAILSSIFIVLLIILYIVNPVLNWKSILNVDMVPEKELSIFALVVFTFFFLKFIFQIIEVVSDAKQEPAINKFFTPITGVICLLSLIFIIDSFEQNLIIPGFILSFTPVLVLVVASLILFNYRYKDVKPSHTLIKFKHVNIT